jgi:hypothetical protein
MRTSMDDLMQSIHDDLEKHSAEHPTSVASLPPNEATKQNVGRNLEGVQIARSLKTEVTSIPPSPLLFADRHSNTGKEKFHVVQDARLNDTLQKADFSLFSLDQNASKTLQDAQKANFSLFLLDQNASKTLQDAQKANFPLWPQEAHKASFFLRTMDQKSPTEIAGCAPIPPDRVPDIDVLKRRQEAQKLSQDMAGLLIRAVKDIVAAEVAGAKLRPEKEVPFKAVQDAIAQKEPLDQNAEVPKLKAKDPVEEGASPQATAAHCQSMEDHFSSMTQLEAIGRHLEGALR